jgi:hypothetical protein
MEEAVGMTGQANDDNKFRCSARKVKPAQTAKMKTGADRHRRHGPNEQTGDADRKPGDADKKYGKPQVKDARDEYNQKYE